MSDSTYCHRSFDLLPASVSGWANGGGFEELFVAYHQVGALRAVLGAPTPSGA